MYYRNIIFDNGQIFDLSNGPLFVNQNDQSNDL